MNLMGIGLNNISLLALALVVGLVIGDAIVVRESILRWVHKAIDRAKRPASARQWSSCPFWPRMLMGLVTKNSILLVDFANREREKGANVEYAMLKAGPIRLRPILMTSQLR